MTARPLRHLGLTCAGWSILAGLLGLSGWGVHSYRANEQKKHHEWSQEAQQIQSTYQAYEDIDRFLSQKEKIYEAVMEKRFGQSVKGLEVRACLQRTAKECRLKRMVFTLGGPQRKFIQESPYEAVELKITLASSGDWQVYRLLERLHQDLPGRAILTEMGLQRQGLTTEGRLAFLLLTDPGESNASPSLAPQPAGSSLDRRQEKPQDLRS